MICTKNDCHRFVLFIGCFLCLYFEVVSVSAQSKDTKKTSRRYYISPKGNDHNIGNFQHPFQTLEPVNQLQLNAGDTVSFEAGYSYTGSLLIDSLDKGTANSPIRIGSYGTGFATINAGNGTAIQATKCKNLIINNLILKGIGRKQGNTGNGIIASNGSNITINHIDVSGFQKSGIAIVECSAVRLEYIDAHDNGYAGIAVFGNHYPKLENHQVYIGHCKAVNNPGDPTELNNHSGNGIVVALSAGVLIEYCMATNNGWDMPRKGNGPVGIWAWESDSVIIQYCISYRNRTATGAMDGGGFDLDGGVRNSIVQYNLTYENEGYGYGIFQYSGASPWHHNTFRFNISYNDGNITHNAASVLWWNGSKDSSQFHDCYFYNNLLYNSEGYALGVVPGEYDNSRFFFINNIFFGKNELMSGGKINSERFYGNDWWSIEAGFKVNGNTNFIDWANKSGKEKLGNKIVGININPFLKNPATPGITDPAWLKTLKGFQLNVISPLRNKGLDIKTIFGITTGGKDFYNNTIPRGKGFEQGVFEMR